MSEELSNQLSQPEMVNEVSAETNQPSEVLDNESDVHLTQASETEGNTALDESNAAIDSKNSAADKHDTGYEKRISKLTADLKYQREVNAALRRSTAAGVSANIPDAQLGIQADVNKPVPPDRSAFSDPLDYVDAVRSYDQKARVYEETQRAIRVNNEVNAARLNSIHQEHVGRANEMVKIYADYDEKVQTVARVLQPEQLLAIMRSENSAEVAYFLSNNPEELADLIECDPMQTAYKIGKLEAQVLKEKSIKNQYKPMKAVKGADSSVAPSDSKIDDLRKRLADAYR